MRALDVLRRAEWLNGARAQGYAVILALMLALAGGAVLQGRARSQAADPAHRVSVVDFVAFYAAGGLTLRGTPALAYDPVATDHAQRAMAQLPGGFLAFYYPPVLLGLCALVALLPFGPAWVVWCLLGHVPLALALVRVLRARFAWLQLVAAPAVVMTWANGQSGFLPAAAFAWGAVLLERRPVLAGLCLSGLCVKPHMALAAPLALLAARRWRALAGFALGVALLVGLSLALFGLSPWWAFVQNAAAAEHALAAYAPHWHKLLSIVTALRIAGLGLPAAYAAQALGSLACLTAVALVARRRPGGLAEMAVAACATPLISPHTLDYDLPMLLLPLAWVSARALQTGWRDWEKLSLLGLYLLPLTGRILTMAVGLPVGPVALAAGLYVCCARAWAAPQDAGVAAGGAACPAA